MDSSNAERPIPKVVALNRAYNAITRDDYTPESIDAAIANLYATAFKSGRASRDAEVAELIEDEQEALAERDAALKQRDKALEALAESRARFADSEARRAELEAVIEQLRDEANAIIDTTRENGTDFERGQENISERVFDVLAVHPPVVLEDRDREVAARALEEAADHYHGDLSLGPELRPVGWANRLRQRAAAIRKGDNA